jgi:alkaline phosphatase D
MKRRHVIPATALALQVASQAVYSQSADAWRLSLGSCANQKVAQPIWQTILADRPDLHIFGGDNVYASDQP